MRIEVICIQKEWHPEQVKRARERFNMVLPQYEKTYHIVGEHHGPNNEVYVDLEEYPPIGGFIMHSFPKESFAEVQSLNDEIAKALKAPNPDKKKHYNDCDGYYNGPKKERFDMEPPRNLQHAKERIQFCHSILGYGGSTFEDIERAVLYLKLLRDYIHTIRHQFGR